MKGHQLYKFLTDFTCYYYALVYPVQGVILQLKVIGNYNVIYMYVSLGR